MIWCVVIVALLRIGFKVVNGIDIRLLYANMYVLLYIHIFYGNLSTTGQRADCFN